MNKLKALGTAAVISITALGGAMPAIADHAEWKLAGYNSAEGTTLLYDTQHITRRGSLVATTTKLNSRTNIVVVDCAQGTYAIASLNGDFVTGKKPIRPDSLVDGLADEVCY